MNNRYHFFFLLLTFFLSLSFLISFNLLVFDNASNFLSSVWFQKSIDVDKIVKTYNLANSKLRYMNEGVKIMIVPGHDDKNFGALYGNVKESDLNVLLGKKIYDLLSKERGVEVFLTRDINGYNKELEKYLKENSAEIIRFQQEKKAEMNKLVNSGKIDTYTNIFHNSAKSEVVQILYGINKFANDNDFDIVLHLHFNDYSGRTGKTGKYSGFSIYIPEKQFSNAEASREFAEKIYEALNFWFAESDMEKENGITEDQELIAIGAYNTANMISVLLEYGYIYESQFHYPEIKEIVFDELANQTYLGIMNFLKEEKHTSTSFDAFEDYVLSDDLSKGDKGKSVLALQHFLRKNGYYPLNDNLNECPINGNFGNCTLLALKEFQRDNNLNADGYVNLITRNIINNY